MNRAKLTGRIQSIEPERSFLKEGAEYKYRTVILDVDHGIIAANYWKEDELPPVGSLVEFTLKINSNRNKNNPDVFYHTLNLHSINEHSERISSEVQY